MNIFNENLRDSLINLTLSQLGKPYKHGAHGEDKFDCAGLVWYLFNEIYNLNLYDGGIGLSTTTKIMTSKPGKLILFEENDINKDLDIINKADIVFFHRQSLHEHVPTKSNKYPGHCGIYLGNRQFIHASRTDQKVTLTDLSKDDYWVKILVGSKDISYNI